MFPFYFFSANVESQIFSFFFFFQWLFHFIFYFLLFIFLAALGLCCCAWAFSSCCELGATLRCSAWASHCSGFSCCGAQALEHAGFSSCGTWAQQLRRTGLVAPQHVGSSQTRDGTHVPCIGWRILNHCATRDVRECFLAFSSFQRLPACVGLWPLPPPLKPAASCFCCHISYYQFSSSASLFEDPVTTLGPPG